MVRGAILLAVAGLVAAGLGFAWTGGETPFSTSGAAKLASTAMETAPIEPLRIEPQAAPARVAPQAGTAPEPMPKTRGLSSDLAQSYSNKCRIPDGSICYVAAQPVGASCECPGSKKGVIVW
ncbi:hypothetical protein QO034_11365 [Sedimentitalea sp. JM2-8]|uniref:Uncharacterized protein n=1 Tax=Sedimentitalea xiamensis TaxID=3050037 RepID=A0ABT7FF17_9RHOB|nr:hypothetical protein [Sedimentitalea xiamensis]MDK3073712.1 hypothetical protein [Sedimentitalea xiamensis]